MQTTVHSQRYNGVTPQSGSAILWTGAFTRMLRILSVGRPWKAILLFVATLGLGLALLPLPIACRGQTPPETVRCGIDVLQRDGFRQLAGKRVGLITNQTGINRRGEWTARILQQASNVDLVALFSPEHGIAGKLDTARIGDSEDSKTGLKIYSLYGASRRPTTASLRAVDVLVFDIQDIGTRFYTYISTLGNAMEAAAEQDVEFVVLDRPNPINGIDVDGPVLDAGRESFVGYHTIPVRHGMTVGELAQMFKAERSIDVRLTVIPVERWRRADFFDRTGLLWVNPSPNMRSLTEAVLYPGIGLLETTNLSVGRGTDTPFELIGAPWLDGQRLAAHLNRSALRGIRFVPLRFTPDSSKYAGQECGGVAFVITDRAKFRPIDTGLEIARQLRSLYQDEWDYKSFNRLLASQTVWTAVGEKLPLPQIRTLYRDSLDRFKQRRRKFLIYPE